MLELDKKVFGNITTKEIIGSDPPATPDTLNRLENELAAMILELKSVPKHTLNDLLKKQLSFDAHINSRPGTMALAQKKIQLYNTYSKRYTDAIKLKLGSFTP